MFYPSWKDFIVAFSTNFIGMEKCSKENKTVQKQVNYFKLFKQ